MSHRLRRLTRALLPGVAVVVGVVVAARRFEVPTIAAFVDRYGLVVYAAGVVPALVFRRSRVVLAVVALWLVDQAVGGVGPDGGAALAGAVLLGLLGALGVTRDRGMLARVALVQAGIVAAVAVATWRALGSPEAVQRFSDLRLFAAEMPLDDLLPQATWAGATVALVLGAFGAWRWGGAVERALLWSQLLVLAGLLVPDSVAPWTLWTAAAGLVLCASVLETSYSMAYRDELTGLPARRALMQDLSEITGAFTLAMVDVDHFKRFNDTYGHDVGDQVLKLVASRLAACPGGGKAYRYGGEEFTLLFHGRSAHDVMPHLEEVRGDVQRATFSLRSWRRPRKKPKAPKRRRREPRKLSVTVSIGAADNVRSRPGEPAAVLKRADEALYRAKQAGRNRVSL